MNQNDGLATKALLLVFAMSLAVTSDVAFPTKKQKTRPPVSGPLRRLPGQSVREELDRVVNEGIAAYIFTPLVSGR
jgi:hypothetical protein